MLGYQASARGGSGNLPLAELFSLNNDERATVGEKGLLRTYMMTALLHLFQIITPLAWVQFTCPSTLGTSSSRGPVAGRLLALAPLLVSDGKARATGRWACTPNFGWQIILLISCCCGVAATSFPPDAVAAAGGAFNATAIPTIEHDHTPSKLLSRHRHSPAAEAYGDGMSIIEHDHTPSKMIGRHRHSPAAETYGDGNLEDVTTSKHDHTPSGMQGGHRLPPDPEMDSDTQLDPNEARRKLIFHRHHPHSPHRHYPFVYGPCQTCMHYARSHARASYLQQLHTHSRGRRSRPPAHGAMRSCLVAHACRCLTMCMGMRV